MYLLVVPISLEIVVALIGATSVVLLFHLLNRIVFAPARAVYHERESPPPSSGYSVTITLDDSDRTKRISVGRIDSFIKTRMDGIREDHLGLLFRKEKNMEEYAVTIYPGGTLLYSPPHGVNFEPLTSQETFVSSELIGHVARFRLVALMHEHRPIHYIDFELKSDYFISGGGEERMKFILTLKKIFPSVNKNIKNKKGVYSFGNARQTEDQEE